VLHQQDLRFETEDYVVDEEVQIFGGYGYIHGNHPELAYRNARINRIWEGTNEINRIVIANTVMRRATKGAYDLKGAYERVAGKLEITGRSIRTILRIEGAKGIAPAGQRRFPLCLWQGS